MDGLIIKTSCMAVVLDHGNPNNLQCLIIGYIGGYYDERKDWNVWWDEIENSVYIDDIFLSAEMPPKEPGFYVWEGEAEPVFEDAPTLSGKWRIATVDDFEKFQQSKKENK